jgi:hypothetical protein
MKHIAFAVVAAAALALIGPRISQTPQAAAAAGPQALPVPTHDCAMPPRGLAGPALRFSDRAGSALTGEVP